MTAEISILRILYLKYKAMKRFLTIVFILFYSVCFSQNRAENMIKINGVTEIEAFDKTLERLMQSPYFVEFSDKGSKLLQCKFMLKDKRLLSGKIGDIIHYNILFKNANDGGTLVYIQANLTEKSNSGSSEIKDYYNNDLGITTDRRYIDPLFEFIRNGFKE